MGQKKKTALGLPTRRRSKRCKFCQELFDPDPRRKGKQKYCPKPECQNNRQRKNEYDWRKNNPDCLEYQRGQSRQWHKERPGYSRERREANSELKQKNREDSRLRMQKIRLFDKSKVILTQIAGGHIDKCYLAKGFSWVMLRLTKASPLTKWWSMRHNRHDLKRTDNQLPKGRLYDAANAFG